MRWLIFLLLTGCAPAIVVDDQIVDYQAYKAHLEEVYGVAE